MSLESSAAVYDALCKELGPKGIKSLNNIKSACDLIVSSRGMMNYSRVASLATENYGGPKKQSVQNNKNLKRYIDARVDEYTQARKSHQLPANKKQGATQRSYPAENLDPRTKTYIDQMHTRLDLAEARYRELRKWQEQHTRSNPLSLAKAIGKGPSDSGAMQLEHTNNNSELMDQVHQGVKSLLNLTNFIGSLQFETRGDKKKLTLDRPAGKHVVLTPQQLEAIELFLDDQRGS